MKKIISGMAAFILCGSLLNALPVGAEYASSQDFTVSLRALSGGYIPAENPNRIYISSQDAQNGTTVHFGTYAEAEYPDIVILTLLMQSENEHIKFDHDSFHSPSSRFYDAAQEFTLPDGTAFYTNFKPYCFGRLNSSGNYTVGGTFLPIIEENQFKVQWMYSYSSDPNSKTAAFLGGISDYFSFIEFDMQIDSGTEPGRYFINFLTNEEYPDQATCVSSNADTPNPEQEGTFITHYADMIPALKPAEIIITDDPPMLEADPVPCFRFAEDSTPFSVQDFQEQLPLSYGGDSLLLNTSDLLDTFEAGSPSDLSITTPQERRLPLTLSGVDVQDTQGNPAELEYHIGLKGDANLDGQVNARDAAQVLVYATQKGLAKEASLSGTSDPISERLAYFLADIDGESVNEGEDGSLLNATDAARILKYVTLRGSDQEPDWNDLKN